MSALNTFFGICEEEFPKYLNSIKEEELYAAADLICEAQTEQKKDELIDKILEAAEE